MKRKLKSKLKKAKANPSTGDHGIHQKFTSYDTSKPQTDTYQEVREKNESSHQLMRSKKAKNDND